MQKGGSSSQPMNARRVTMTDVARHAGVSLGTVSRVVNQRPGVDQQLKERVVHSIAELGYRPNARARTFAQKSSVLISFILSNRDFLHAVHSRILEGVEEFCEEAGYMVVFSRFNYSVDTPVADLLLPRVLRAHGVADSLILAGTNFDNFVEAVEKIGAPYVLFANNFISKHQRPPVDQVRLDDFAGAYEATRYLIQLGHRDIWYIGDIALPWYRVRHDAFVRAMDERGLTPRAQTMALSDNTFANGFASAQWILDQGSPVSAIFAGSDDIAFGVLDLAWRRGVNVPRDLSVIGVGNVPESSFKIPPLTSVGIDFIETGRELARLAILKAKSPEERYPEVVIPASLVKRGTTQPRAADAAATTLA